MTGSDPREAARAASCARGFTLVESIVGLVLLSVCVPPLLWALAESRRTAAAPAQAEVAYWLASERLEDLVADRCSPGRGFAYLTPAHYPDEKSVEGFSGFSRSVTLTGCGPDLTPPEDGFVLARVTVRWTGARGTSLSVSATTVLAEKLP
ncbi:MAG: prepilin-type N-terminal cleavage/methylation domain-containing protein [Phycisphaerales bacterium]|nr:prepilin-type N-terminal cleavage/methylation domain-containing protein [Phycisphaerales bacterium]